MKHVIKKLVPFKVRDMLKCSMQELREKILLLANKSKIYSGLYYLISGDFKNEYYAVLRGRKTYFDSLKNIGTSCALLRRNIHRIEKGLIMRPRRSVFGESFILETVSCYKSAVQSPVLALDEKKWATDVLEEYFKVVGDSAITNEARKTYQYAKDYWSSSVVEKKRLRDEHSKYKPYLYSQLPVNRISFDQISELYRRRRSVRWYQDKHVPLELVQKAANIASLAPSACNRQPYSFYFCNEKTKAVAIAKCANGTKGFAENLPSIIAVVGDLSVYSNERDRHLIYIDGSLGAMQLMLALETLGLSTCSINWPDLNVNEERLRKIIDLKDYQRVVMLLAVGYADPVGGIPYSQKKENNLILMDISQ